MKRILAMSIAAFAIVASDASPAHGAMDAAAPAAADFAALRTATRPFRHVHAAEAAGYSQFQDCKAEPGHGAMGIHYLNGGLAEDSVLDPLRPEALMYEPDRTGKLELVGVEYIVFQAGWDATNAQPPVLYGHPFHLVREPNRYGVPAFYELHVWLWRHNPDGVFNDWNPTVTCR